MEDVGPLGIALAVSALFGLGEREIAAFERIAAADIAQRLQGPDKVVEVDVQTGGLETAWGHLPAATIRASKFSLDRLPLYTEPHRSTAGKLGSLNLELRDFILRGLRIESLSAAIPQCRYDFQLALRKRQIRLSRSGIGTGEVRIRQEDLAAYILKKYRDIKRVTVRADYGVAWVEGYGEFLLAKTEFTVIARIGIEDGTKLILEKPKIYFDWVRAEPAAADALLSTLNPIVDMRADLGLLDAIHVEEVDCRNGYLIARGRTKIPVAPADNQN